MTIGYGDFIPVTLPGRLIILTSGISGTIFLSIIINFISNFMSLSEKELTVLRFVSGHE